MKDSTIMKKHLQEVTLLGIVFLSFAGITMSLPILSPLFLDPAYSHVFPIPYSESVRSILLGCIIAVYPLGQFIGSPLLGAISDSKGRKKALLFTLIGATVGYFFTGVGLFTEDLWLVALSRFITGILEGNLAIARSIALDVNESKKHTIFGKISASASVGLMVGPLLGGIFSNHEYCPFFHFWTPFFVAGLLSLFAFLLAAAFLDESLTTSNVASFDLRKSLAFVQRIKNIGIDQRLAKMLLVWLVIVLAIDTYNNFLPAFLSLKWKMSPLRIAFFNAFLCLWYVGGSVWLVPAIAKYWHPIKSIRYGMIIYTFFLIPTLFINNPYAVLPLFIISDLAAAVTFVNVFVYTSDVGKKNNQGEVMGYVMSVRTLGDGLVGFLGGVFASISANMILVFSILTGIGVIFLLKNSKELNGQSTNAKEPVP